MYQEKDPVGAIEPKELIARLNHRHSFNYGRSISDLLGHLHDNDFKLHAHEKKYLQKVESHHNFPKMSFS